MKRQIIKTKPVQPYRIARIVLAVVVTLLLALAAYVAFRVRPHATHTGVAMVVSAGVAVRQDLPIFDRNTQSPIALT